MKLHFLFVSDTITLRVNEHELQSYSAHVLHRCKDMQKSFSKSSCPRGIASTLVGLSDASESCNFMISSEHSPERCVMFGQN